MSSSTAAAPARKKVPNQSEVSALMAEMGSLKGFDPMPPDQYLYFLGKKEPPLQRLLAMVRACTVQRGRRSAHCVDERGKDLRLADLEKLLDMEHGNFKRVMREAIERGLIRVGRAEPGSGQNSHNSRHPHRIYLCGSVAESNGYEGGEEKGGVCTDPLRFLSITQKEVYAGWRKDQQERFYAEFDSAVNYKLQVEREAIALARHIGDRALDQVFAAHALPKTRLATAPPESKLLQLTLVPAVDGSVQTRSVPTPASGPVLTAIRESVPSGASFMPLENREAAPESVGQSTSKAAERPTDRHADAEDYGAKTQALKTLLLDEYGKRFPGDVPSPPLCAQILTALAGAPLDLLQTHMRQRSKSATGMGFAIRLAEDVGRRWQIEAPARAQASAAGEQHAHANREETRTLCQETLDDPRASAEEKDLAREVLKSMAAGGVS